MEGIEDRCLEQSLFPCASDVGDIFGDPLVLPRIGDEYQSKIPPLIAECDRLQLVYVPGETVFNSEVTLQVCDSFLLGLPIPVMWSNVEVEHINGTVEFENSEESQISSTSNEWAKLKVEPVDAISGFGKGLAVCSNLKQEVGTNIMGVDLHLAHKFETKINQVERGCCPLPGSLDGSWTDIECDSFLLGLYVFGKNLTFVKRFVESKEMGDILSFYYGKFYRSAEYRRWSESRKLKSRRIVHGQKIFTGWRQQEILSRLSSRVSQECQTTFLKVSRKFGEGKISFEEYVFSLKGAAGTNLFIEAISIGKGKQDLTGTAMEPIRSNQTVPLRPEIPIGKACSSLTSADIIKFLTGDFRLSKARSSDLFWEAVWPRLLARGWHSELPKDHGISGNKHSLVFLVPAVKKFSRRRLVKGKHYFDSVSDVLNKVASDPGLLELETEGGQHKEEYGWNPSVKEDQDGLPNKKRHHYLQPRKSANGFQCAQKFTIVDTSLVHGAARPKVRELRSLPVETTNLSTSSSLSSDSECGTSEESQDEADEHNTLNASVGATDRIVITDPSDCINTNSSPNTNVPNDLVATVLALDNHENQSTDKQKRKSMTYQFSRKVKSGRSKYLVPITKQQDVTDCERGELSCNTESMPVDRKVNVDESHCMSNPPDGYEDMDFQVDPTRNLSSACSLAKDRLEGSNEGIVGEICQGREASLEKPQSPSLIDLNVPYVSPDFAAAAATVIGENGENSCINNSSFVFETSRQREELHLPEAKSSPGQQAVMNSRRQSTRSRPLTTKALEALESGFLMTKKKRKDSDTPESNSTSRSSRRVRPRAVVKTTSNDVSGNDMVESRTEKYLDGFHSDIDMAGESHV